MFNYTRWIISPLLGVTLGLGVACLVIAQRQTPADKLAVRRGFRNAADFDDSQAYVAHQHFGKHTYLDAEGMRIFSKVMASGSPRARITLIITAGQINDIPQMRQIVTKTVGFSNQKSYQEPLEMMLRRWALSPGGKAVVESFGNAGGAARELARRAVQS